MDIGDISVHFKDKCHLQTMIDKLGKKEAVQRLAWLHDYAEVKVETLVNQFLTDDYYDDKGVKGGREFWGDL